MLTFLSTLPNLDCCSKMLPRMRSESVLLSHYRIDHSPVISRDRLTA
jgi:hypothetical protein